MRTPCRVHQSIGTLSIKHLLKYPKNGSPRRLPRPERGFLALLFKDPISLRRSKTPRCLHQRLSIRIWRRGSGTTSISVLNFPSQRAGLKGLVLSSMGVRTRWRVSGHDGRAREISKSDTGSAGFCRSQSGSGATRIIQSSDGELAAADANLRTTVRRFPILDGFGPVTTAIKSSALRVVPQGSSEATPFVAAKAAPAQWSIFWELTHPRRAEKEPLVGCGPLGRVAFYRIQRNRRTRYALQRLPRLLRRI